MTEGHSPHKWPNKWPHSFQLGQWHEEFLYWRSQRETVREAEKEPQCCESSPVSPPLDHASCLGRWTHIKTSVHKRMTFKYYQHCKIWLGLIYLLWLSSWVPGGTPVSIYILTWAFVLVKADSLTAMTSHTKAWISDELPTNPWPELCWMHIEGDKLIRPVAVPTGGLALCWALLVEVVHKWASNHCPYPRARK